MCLQETKRADFDASYISKFCPRHLNKFAFLPSVGASRGLLAIWNGNMFTNDIHEISSIAITVKFCSNASGPVFHLLNIYGPSTPTKKAAFVFWFYNIDTSVFEDWILVGDFNLIRTSENRNKSGGSVNDMMMFNDLIQHLDLVDIPFQGRQFT